MKRKSGRPLTVKEFFDLKLPGCSLTDAFRATGIAYSTIHDLSKEKVSSPRKHTLAALETWSKKAAKEHGVFISEARTRGLATEAIHSAEAAQ